MVQEVGEALMLKVGWNQVETHGSRFIPKERLLLFLIQSVSSFVVTSCTGVRCVPWRWPGPARAADDARIRAAWLRRWAARLRGPPPGGRVVLGRWDQRHLQYWRCPGWLTSRCFDAAGCAILLLRRGEELARRWSYACHAGGLSRA